jgi:hypothetical protein
MIQIRSWSEKAWCHEKRRVTQEEITRKQTKLGQGGITWKK